MLPRTSQQAVIDMANLLPDELIHRIHRAAIELQLERKSLLGGIPAGFASSLHTSPSPIAQLLMDLHELNRTIKLRDGSVPLVKWLENAVGTGVDKPEEEVFAEALALLGRPVARTQAPAAAAPPAAQPQAPVTQGAPAAAHSQAPVTPAAPAAAHSQAPVAAPTGTHGMPRIFLSAHPADTYHLERVTVHLKALHEDPPLHLWDHRSTPAGGVRSQLAAKELAAADLVIVFLSANYLADDDLRAEGERALERPERLVPVLVEPVLLQGKFKQVQTLPKDKRPVSASGTPEHEYVLIAEEIDRRLHATVAAAAHSRA